ncbi:MAG TPA: acyl-CoA reductase, partial [Flavisolibacter sp.]|nr:acyl-CoA reductase [Flavisolibacter sp.]
MNLSKRKELLLKLGEYIRSDDEEWENIKKRATAENPWFIPEFINLAIKNIYNCYLQPKPLDQLIADYSIPDELARPKKVGIVMAGNIPLVGFHDLLCVFLTGHIAIVKPSSRDEAMIKHLIEKLNEWDEGTKELIIIKTLIPDCDAYIATGSNNSARYFEFYFSKYPSIIRKNRTSVAILSGKESKEDLEMLADDVYLYFGLGCRNVTKLYVPENYNFIELLNAFKKYDYLADHHKYKNNYDHILAMHILNNQYYMSNPGILLIEN